MRVLWFTDVQPQPVRRRLGMENQPGPQAWVEGLAAALGLRSSVRLTIASPGSRAYAPFVDGGVRYVHLPLPVLESRAERVVRGWQHRLSTAALEAARRLVGDEAPDIVHVHGTENGFGLLAGEIAPVPCAISLQGLLRAYERLYFAGRTPGEVAALVCSTEFVKGRGVMHRYLLLRRQVERETQIMRGASWFIGRTDWDRAVLAAVNPQARYRHCDEIMRAEFYAADWSRRSHSGMRLYSTSSALMGKGTECLLEAAVILVDRGWMDLRVRIAGVHPGSELDWLYRRVARRLGVEACVEWLGRLGASQLVDELEAADVFVYPSHVDNSPNALVEAMLAGAPCVASHVGGIPTLMKDGAEGLLTPRGDAYALADAVERLHDDRQLAGTLGSAARATARRRNDPTRIATETVAIYEDIVRVNQQGPA